MTEQRFFKIRSDRCGDAEHAVWAADDVAHRARTHVGSTASGQDASIWTTDPAHQDRLRTALQAAGIAYREDPYQQVRSQ
jgi:hypothetical protein